MSRRDTVSVVRDPPDSHGVEERIEAKPRRGDRRGTQIVVLERTSQTTTKSNPASQSRRKQASERASSSQSTKSTNQEEGPNTSDEDDDFLAVCTTPLNHLDYLAFCRSHAHQTPLRPRPTQRGSASQRPLVVRGCCGCWPQVGPCALFVKASPFAIAARGSCNGRVRD